MSDREGSREVLAVHNAGGVVCDTAVSQRPLAGAENIVHCADPSTTNAKSKKHAVTLEQDQLDELQPASLFMRATRLLQSTALSRASLFGYGAQPKSEAHQSDTDTVANPRGLQQRDNDCFGASSALHPQPEKVPSNSQQPVIAWPSSAAVWKWVVGEGTNLKGNRPARQDDEENPVTISRPAGSHNFTVISATLRTPENTPIHLPTFAQEVIGECAAKDDKVSQPIPKAEASRSFMSNSASASHLLAERNLRLKSIPSLQVLYSADALVSSGSLSPLGTNHGLLKLENSITCADMLSLLRECIQAKTMSLGDDDMARMVLKACKFDISRPSGAFVRSFGLLMFIHTQINFYGLDPLPDLRPALRQCISNLRKTDDVIEGCNLASPKRILAGYGSYLSDKLLFLSNIGNTFEGNYAVARHIKRTEIEQVDPERAHQHRDALRRMLLLETLDGMLDLLRTVNVLLAALTGSDEELAEALYANVRLSAGEVSGRKAAGRRENHVRDDPMQPLVSITSKGSSIEIGLREETKDTLSFYILAEAVYLSQAILCLIRIHDKKADAQSRDFNILFSKVVERARALAVPQSSLLRASWAEHTEIGEIRFDMSRLLGDHHSLSIEFPVTAKIGNLQSDFDALRTSMPRSYAYTVECTFTNFANLHIAMGEAIASASR
jgi:hypothetical protein